MEKARHCFICKRCVLEHHRHSFILNNCVGKRNRIYVISYLSITSILLVLIILSALFHYTRVYAVGDTSHDHSDVFHVVATSSSLVSLIILGFTLWALYGYCKNERKFKLFSKQKKQAATEVLDLQPSETIEQMPRRATAKKSNKKKIKIGHAHIDMLEEESDHEEENDDVEFLRV